MPPRNHKQWSSRPKVEYISSECYNNYEIFQREIKDIFAKVWVPVCHMSEIPNVFCYRTSQIAFQNVIVWNTGDGVEAFLNNAHRHHLVKCGIEKPLVRNCIVK